jgi:2,4-dienoyl-CoA reductase-like NADH-dependent reductase (Old Yellow Enzyme family)
LLELIDLVRAVIPDEMPLFVRISATDWLEHLPEVDSWELEDTIRLAKLLESRGVDLFDISSGGSDPRQRVSGSIQAGLGYQVAFSAAVKKALGPNSRLLVSAVGGIKEGKQAETILQEGQADVVRIMSQKVQASLKALVDLCWSMVSERS